MLLRVADGSASVLAATAISDFIAQALRPVEPASLAIVAQGAVLSDRRRGERAGLLFDLGSGLLTDITYEFDLGDEDAVFAGLDVIYEGGGVSDNRFAPIPEFPIEGDVVPTVLVQTSQFRPTAGRDWQQGYCNEAKWQATRIKGGIEPAKLNCVLSRSVIARGIRITLRGVPGRWRELRLNLAK